MVREVFEKNQQPKCIMTIEEQKEVVDYWRQKTLFTDDEIHMITGIPHEFLSYHMTENTLFDRIEKLIDYD